MSNIQKLIEVSKCDIDEAATACFMFFQGTLLSIISKDETISLFKTCAEWLKCSEEDNNFASYKERFSDYYDSFIKHFQGCEREYLEYARRVKKEFPESEYIVRLKWVASIIKNEEKSSSNWAEFAA